MKIPEAINFSAGLPRAEYPRPRLVRQGDWLNLNGTWRFAYDHGRSAVERGFAANPKLFGLEITVPFCPESPLSGIGNRDFIEACAYSREVEIPASWAGKTAVLHFDAVDYRCRVFWDGKEIGSHCGGSTGFEFVLDAVPGAHHLAVFVTDEVRSGLQGVGKQCARYASFGCDYTRVTGIWRTVWMEVVNAGAVKDFRLVTDIDNSAVTITPAFYGTRNGDRLEVEILADGIPVAVGSFSAADGIPLTMKLEGTPRLWSPEAPFRYELKMSVMRDGDAADTVSSFFGMRKVHCENGTFMLNNKPFFSRMVLEQGYDPEGLWTTPSVEKMEEIIRKCQALGFNGARLHQKLFEDVYLEIADRLGFVVWSEYPSWGINLHDATARENFLGEWQEAVCERVNHPSVIAWVPFNETFLYPNEFGKAAAFPTPGHLAGYRRFISMVYDLTHRLDPSRPVCDCSGWYHVKTDLWTVHIYCFNPEELTGLIGQAPGYSRIPEYEVPYSGQPFFVDEWGGFRYIPGNKTMEGWGYGRDMTSPEELIAKVAEQIEVMMKAPGLQGYCYTQLYDIEQEQNGLLDAALNPKAEIAGLYRHFSRSPEK